MVRLFDKNMFIMLLSIMIGVVIITFFVADINARSEEQEKHSIEIGTIEQKNINFTSNFMKSNVLLDQAREDRSFGNYHFDLGLLWYQSALAEKNETTMDTYKLRGIDNCTRTKPYFLNSHLNFGEAQNFFIETKTLTTYPNYLEILDKYIDLTESGATLTLLRYNASIYLQYLTENLTFDPISNNVTYLELENISDLIGLLDDLLSEYEEELKEYEEIKEEIDEYEFFDEIR